MLFSRARSQHSEIYICGSSTKRIDFRFIAALTLAVLCKLCCQSAYIQLHEWWVELDFCCSFNFSWNDLGKFRREFRNVLERGHCLTLHRKNQRNNQWQSQYRSRFANEDQEQSFIHSTTHMVHITPSLKRNYACSVSWLNATTFAVTTIMVLCLFSLCWHCYLSSANLSDIVHQRQRSMRHQSRNSKLIKGQLKGRVSHGYKKKLIWCVELRKINEFYGTFNVFHVCSVERKMFLLWKKVCRMWHDKEKILKYIFQLKLNGTKNKLFNLNFPRGLLLD